jgi:prolyl-tRNA editing enzyme YbaK/EbsC (Cys-tRNA(Pro) deacylase)
MGIFEVRRYFKQHGIPEEIREFDVSSATVDLAALALGVAPQRIAKTLSFEKDGSALLVLAAGDARIDNRKFRETFGRKAKMLSPEDALRLTGHPVGGVCPFATATRVEIYLDNSLKRFDIVYPAAGSPASCVVVSPDRLQEITADNGYKYAM